MNPSDNSRVALDSALFVRYTPDAVGHLVVTTTGAKMLKFDARTGRLVAEYGGVHRSGTPKDGGGALLLDFEPMAPFVRCGFAGITALDLTDRGRHLATAGDRLVKIWHYTMKLDVNFQVFIGHSAPIGRVLFTPDQLGLVSVGEAIFVWDFYGEHPLLAAQGPAAAAATAGSPPSRSRFGVAAALDRSLVSLPASR